jgi:predicted O-linked N-acetylglucosamine transferase (SPINDLY family)
MPVCQAEQPLCLPRSMFCYRPPSAPDIGPVPALRNGSVTFGSFNNVAKLSDHTLALWARTLHAVPGSRLMLKSASITSTATRDNVVAFMGRHGIGADRLQLVARIDHRDGHLALYNEIDIALDPFPYNGATTTCEALWMGVPVVSQRGRTHASRMGASILGAAGQAGWVTEDDAAFVCTAAQLAADVEGLASWRRHARERLRASPLLDEPGFARCFEAALERAWAQRCKHDQATAAAA